MLRQRLDNDSISNHSCLCTVLSRQFLRKGKENICQRLNLQSFFTMHCLIKILVRLLVSIVGKSHLRKGSTYFMGVIPIYKFTNQASITNALFTILELRFISHSFDMCIEIEGNPLQKYMYLQNISQLPQIVKNIQSIVPPSKFHIL